MVLPHSNPHGYGLGAQKVANQAQENANRAQAYEALFATELGQFVLNDILTRLCHHGKKLVHPDPDIRTARMANHDLGIDIKRLASGMTEHVDVEVKKQ